MAKKATRVKEEIEVVENLEEGVILKSIRGENIKPRNQSQKEVVDCINNKDLVAIVGPAGSGKSYIAIAMAVRALNRKEVKKIILTRPAVEAGESLGYLPGGLKDKLDPYLRPLYDALEDMIPPPKLRELMDSNVIEIAPLAYMRGRTLSNAFIILDEAQNTTLTQLKMFLTRMGERSKVVITGDLSQIDLPKWSPSGFADCIDILSTVDGASVIKTKDKEIIRHPLIRHILKSFEALELKNLEAKKLESLETS